MAGCPGTPGLRGYLSHQSQRLLEVLKSASSRDTEPPSRRASAWRALFDDGKHFLVQTASPSGAALGTWWSQGTAVVELERHSRSQTAFQTFPCSRWKRACSSPTPPCPSSLLEVVSDKGGAQVFPPALLGCECGLSRRLPQAWALSKGAPRPRNSLET